MLVIASPGPGRLGLRALVGWSGAVLVPGWLAAPVVLDVPAAPPLLLARADQVAPVFDAALVDAAPEQVAAVPSEALQLAAASAADVTPREPIEADANATLPAAAAGGAPAMLLVQGSGAIVELPASAPAATSGGAAIEATPAPTPGSPAEAARTPGGSGFKFRLAPIRWIGNVAEIVTWTKDGQGTTRFQNIVTSNVAGSSYIWQPWFAQVSGNLGLVHGTSKSSGNDARFGDDSSTDFGVTGGAALSLFPVSRFPFSASFDRSDSRTTGIATATDFTSTRFTLRQDYAPLGSPWTFSAGFDRSIVDATQTGRDTVDVFKGSLARSAARQQFQANGQYSSNRTARGDEFTFGNASLRHSWQAASNLTVDSFGNYSRSQQDVEAAGGSFRNATSVIDASSFVNWQPATERPLLVTGNVRFSRLQFDNATNSLATQSYAAGVNANYSWSKNLSLFGNGQLTFTDTATGSEVLSLVGGGASYASDMIQFGGFSYSWNASGSANYQAGGERSEHLLLGTFGHNLFRNVYASERSNVSMSLGQTLTVAQSGTAGNAIGIGHSAGANWSLQQSEKLFTNLSATVTDTRTSGDQDSSVQQLSLQANGNMQFSRYATAAANLTVQGTRQDNPGSSLSNGTQWNIYGTLGYQHGRAFGIPRLRYSALYTGNTLQLNGREQGNVNAVPNQVSHSLEQRLYYRIGRLDLEGLLRFSEIDGNKNTFIFIRVNRQFGSF